MKRTDEEVVMGRVGAKKLCGVCLPLVLTAGSLLSVGVLQAQKSTDSGVPVKTLTLHLDPDQSKVDWSVDVMLHRVHGTFKMKNGEVIADPKSGVAQGEVLIDAASGTTGDAKRDERWQKDVLDSANFPAILFHPSQIDGLTGRDGEQTVHTRGTITLHGTDHPVDLSVKVEESGYDVTATAHFDVPYVKWGLKDPSSGFTRYGKNISVELVAKGRLVEQTAKPSPVQPGDSK